MLYTIGYWLTAVPMGEPWRAIVIVAEVLAFAFALHWLWELSFMLVSRLCKVASRFNGRRRVGVPASRSSVAITNDPVWEIRAKPLVIQAGKVSDKADDEALA